MGRVIAIAGFAPDSRDLVNNEPNTTEIWGMNNAYHFLKRKAKVWFQIHPPDWNTGKPGLEKGEYGREKGHVEWLSKFDGPVYMQAPEPRVPNCTVLPLEEIKAHFGKLYLTSSMAYMMALLVMQHDRGEKVESVHVWGINLTTNAEYFEQKACLEYWLGMAEGRGIAVTLPPVTALMRGRLYAHVADANDMLAMTKSRVEHWRAQVMKHRDWSIWGYGSFVELRAVYDRLEDTTGRKQVEERLRRMQFTVDQHMKEQELATVAMRESQHLLISLGGFDTTATEIPEMMIPMRPFPVVPDVPLEKLPALAPSTSSGQKVKPEPVAP